MTDNEINEAIERLMGREPCEGWSQMMSAAAFLAGGIWQSSCGHQGDTCYPAGHPRNVCTDPAAWGALLVWMANDRSPRGTSLNWWPDEGLWEACIGALDGEDSIAVMSAHPGRALALAALRAYGVEVTP